MEFLSASHGTGLSMRYVYVDWTPKVVVCRISVSGHRLNSLGNSQTAFVTSFWRFINSLTGCDVADSGACIIDLVRGIGKTRF